MGYFEKGVLKLIHKVFTGANTDFYKARELNPEYAKAYYNSGNAKVKLQDYTGAIEDYTKAIALNPEYAYAYYNRGLAKYDLKILGACNDWIKAGELGHTKAFDWIKKYCQ